MFTEYKIINSVICVNINMALYKSDKFNNLSLSTYLVLKFELTIYKKSILCVANIIDFVCVFV
jgi:hypothetical protein